MCDTQGRNICVVRWLSIDKIINASTELIVVVVVVVGLRGGKHHMLPAIITRYHNK